MKGYTLSVTYLKPDKSTRGHTHKWDEAYYIGRGVGLMQLNDKYIRICEGQFVGVPPNTFHRIFNTGILDLAFVCAWRGK